MLISLHPQVVIHNASDKSGILLFSGFTGATVRLSCQFDPVISLLAEQSESSKADFISQLKQIDASQADRVWHTLVSNFIVVERGSDPQSV